MNEQIKFLSEKPNTLVKYGKVIVFNDQNQFFLKQLQNANDSQSQVKKNTEQILNIILPPLYFKNDNQENCYQQVVTTPAKISDVVSLQQSLDQELLSQQGRETGICPIRERLYSECFDELIRQITVNCSHRGIMLVRVRDELRNTIETYQQLYLSSLGFGVRTSLKGENEDKFLKNQIEKFQNEIQTLESDIDRTKKELIDISQNQQGELDKINTQYQQRMEVVQIEHQELKEKFQVLLIVLFKLHIMYKTPRKKFTDTDIFPTQTLNYNKTKYKQDLLQQIDEKQQKKNQETIDKQNFIATKINSPYIEGFYFTPKKVDPQQEALDDLLKDMNKKASTINKIYDELTLSKKKYKQNQQQKQSFSIFNTQKKLQNNIDQQEEYYNTRQSLFDSGKVFNNKNNQYFFSQRYNLSNVQKNTLNKNLEIQPISQFDLEGVRDTIKERKFEEKKQRFENYVENILPDELNSYIKDYFDNNFRKFKKDIHKHQKEVYKEIDGLKKFTSTLKSSQERDALDLALLKSEIKQLQQDEIHKRSDLFDALQKTNKKSIKNNKYFKYQTDRIRKKDILKELNNIL